MEAPQGTGEVESGVASGGAAGVGRRAAGGGRR
jgi:hypothetical protein